MGPGIVAGIALRSDDELRGIVKDGLPARGMPGFALTDAESRALVAFTRTLRPRRESRPPRVSVQTVDGRALEGFALNRSATDLQLLTTERRLLLFRASGDRYRAVTSQVDWPTYHGHLRGNRYSAITEIDATNVARLAPAWVFTLPDASRLQVTPLVVDGVMYVTNANECFALDAGSGRRLWHYQRPRTKGLVGDAASGINRGVAVAGDRVFMVTDHAHLIALDRFTGELVWETTMADWRENYGATSAPLAVDDLVVSGRVGRRRGRARLSRGVRPRRPARKCGASGRCRSRGEPGSETWQGRDIEHGCAATWLTGTYDPDLDTLYWPTGNPCPDFDGRERVGDNLYSDSILALDPKTGRLKWHFQYTPHDVWDWDAQQPPVLVDADWQGQRAKAAPPREPQRILLRARSDDGSMLLATPFVKKLTWAREIERRRPPGAESRSDTDPRRHVGLPCRRGRHQLVLDVVQPGDRSLLRADAREVQHLHAPRRDVESG